MDSFGPTRRLTMARSYFGKAFYWCHAYLVDHLLIDTGCPAALRPFQQFLIEERIDQAVVTHYHEDHAGNVIALNLTGIAVFAPEPSLSRIRAGIVCAHRRQTLYGRIFWGTSVGGEAKPLPDRIETERRSLQVIHAPGHSDDMHLFFAPKEGWLFSGDLFIGARKNYWRKEERPLQVIETIKKVLKLDFDTLLCAHSPHLKKGKEALRGKLSYLEEMKEKVQKLADTGRSTRQITKEVFGGEGFWTFITGGDFSRRNFVEGLVET